MTLLLTQRLPKKRITILVDQNFWNRYTMFHVMGRKPLLLEYNAGYRTYCTLGLELLTPTCRAEYAQTKDLSYLVQLEQIFEVMKQGPQSPSDYYEIDWFVNWATGSWTYGGVGRTVFDIRDVEAAVIYAKTAPYWRKTPINDAIGGRSVHDPRTIATNRANAALAEFVSQAAEDERRRDSLDLARKAEQRPPQVDVQGDGDHTGGADPQEEAAVPPDAVGGTPQGGAASEPTRYFGDPLQLHPFRNLPGWEIPGPHLTGEAQSPIPPESVAGTPHRTLRDVRECYVSALGAPAASKSPGMKVAEWAAQTLRRENEQMLHHLKRYTEGVPLQTQGWGSKPLTINDIQEAWEKVKHLAPSRAQEGKPVDMFWKPEHQPIYPDEMAWRPEWAFYGSYRGYGRLRGGPNLQQLPKDKPLSPEVAEELRIERERRAQWVSTDFSLLEERTNDMNRYEYNAFWLDEPARVPVVKVAQPTYDQSVYLCDANLSGSIELPACSTLPITAINCNRDPVTYCDRFFMVMWMYKPTRRNGVSHEMLWYSPEGQRSEVRMQVSAWDGKAAMMYSHNGLVTPSQVDAEGCYPMMHELRHKVFRETGRPYSEDAFAGAVLMEACRDSASPTGLQYTAKLVDKHNNTVFLGQAEVAADLQIDLQAQIIKLYKD